ncbi:hypothetical protein INS49_001197 [Diaporthe citri]|uniref:uncharacterized protein n=1 Tax=Diaporthe citri TaxID=83186 RepID=UPI001C81D6A4|nr:uncharacterized protein INS49_001197 [Diaporthe citri]KAG6367015.1 hypothetical protein INS49_001197 [Diaporthe citri]
MHSQLVIAALAASVSASANLFPAHMAIRRDLLVARQTESATPSATGGPSDTECQASLLAIATELPIPDGDLLDWEQQQTGTDPCSVTEVPSSLSSEYTSYTDAVLSWYAESSSELYAAISACPQYAGAVSEVAVCTSSLTGLAATTGTASNATATGTGSSSEASATGSSTGTATQSGSSDSTGTASGSASSSAETAGAPMREVGIVGAVLAGVLGVAVAL